MARSPRAVQTPGEDPIPESTEQPATSGDAFQAVGTVVGDEPTDALAVLQAQMQAVLADNARLAAAVNNLARSAPVQQAVTQELPDAPQGAELQGWLDQSDDTSPRLTKQGWLVHPLQGATAEQIDAWEQRRERRLKREAAAQG